MSKIQNAPEEILRIYGCTNELNQNKGKRVGKFNYVEKFYFSRDPAVEFLVKDYQYCDEDQILVIFYAAKNIYSLKNLCNKYENDKCAVQEGERVVKGLWGHWCGDKKMAMFYKPHASTMQKITSIKADSIAFLRLCMKKYSSVLKSAICDSKLPSAYLMAHDKVMLIAEEYGDEEEEEEEEVFDRSIVKIAWIRHKTKYVQLGFNFVE